MENGKLHKNDKKRTKKNKVNNGVISVVDELIDVDTDKNNDLPNNICVDSLEELAAFDLTNCNMDRIAINFLKIMAAVVIDIRKAQQFQSSQLDDLVKRNQDMKDENITLKKRLASLEDKNSSLEHKINNLEKNFDELQQAKIKNNIVLAGLPHNLEKLEDQVLNIAKIIKSEISKEDISQVTLLPNKSNQPRNSLYLLEFKSQKAKTEFMGKKKQYKNLFTAELGLATSENKEIFFRHHLTPFQSHLYRQAKEIKISKNFQYLWVKNSQIFICEKESSKHYKISSQSDIDYISKF